ncbi:procollagen C-endopeptidase enhancer 2b isoform X2 [Syngnathoides biaculeatus]|uniref:procollagen C-endopeptidase enhancer 2b isoform X2 n=1 Tax=Syngnathoides biaculeatus TaxID=300417 RepID=UPI002ADE580A|nr:procollagen C-endopeptidase enhancer 2b isoform X2 [Syngnathoides biaculeatus]
MWRVCGLLCAWALALLARDCSAQSQRRPSHTCGGNFTGQTGIIGSQGYPGVYPPNTKCVWRITVPEGKVVVLTFRSLDLENDSMCRYDYVDVHSGHGNGQRLGRFCGTLKPGPLVSTGNKMTLQMVSDANTAGSGFLSVFSAAQPNERGDQYCGGRLDKPSGTFKTPNWPDRDYPAGVTCSWHIVAPKNQIIEVKFEKFDVERDNYCRYDHVSIFNGGEINDARRIGKYCGDSPPAPVYSEGNQLFVHFLSDLSLTADGFIGHYKFRPKRFSVTTTPVPTTTQPVTTRPIRRGGAWWGGAWRGESACECLGVSCGRQQLLRECSRCVYVRWCSLPTCKDTTLKYSVALCREKCKRRGTLESNFCSSNFVITGTVISAVTRGGSVHATVSIIKVYKEGNLAIQQAGKTMSTKMVILCKKCPFVRRGLNYIFMGSVDEEGRGKVGPHHFVLAFKSKNQKALSVLKSKRC